MRLVIIALFGALLLAGCGEQEQVVMKTEYKVVQVPANYYVCRQDAMARVGIRTVQDIEKLTDAKVASLINQLKRDNKNCAASLDAIRQYLERARQTIEKTPAK